MYSMWDAPSDRYYYGSDRLEEEPFCSCGARSDQACEEWCATNLPTEEPEEEIEEWRTKAMTMENDIIIVNDHIEIHPNGAQYSVVRDGSVYGTYADLDYAQELAEELALAESTA